MKFLITAIAITGLIFHSQARAERGGHGAGNGGDEIALEFLNVATSSIFKFKKLNPDYRGPDLQKILDSAEILVTDDTLSVVQKNGQIIQESAVINISAPSSIVIQRARWTAIKKSELRMALALHEVLGLAGLESTGVYSYSKRFLLQQGTLCREGLLEACGAPPVGEDGEFNFATSEAYFKSGVVPTSMPYGKWKLIAHSYLKKAFDENGFPSKDEFNPAGLKNHDKSVNTIEIFQTDSFDISKKNDVVSLKNLGKKGLDQGPNKIVLNESGACFSTWGYDGSTGEKSKNYYSQVCRIMPTNSKRLICAVTYRSKNPQNSWESAWNGKTILYNGYALQEDQPK